MNEYNIYGKGDIDLVLVHGGPGARGSLEDLAKLLSNDLGILEINQSKFSISELIEDMNEYINKTCKKRVTLLGHSWGAWLVCMFAYKYSEKVEKLILVGSGSFELKYVKKFNDRRLNRLNESNKKEYDILLRGFMSNETSNKDEIMSKFGKLMESLDTYEPIFNNCDLIGEANYQMFNSIWFEASKLRKTGELLEIMKEIKVPIHIVQGDYDSHEIKGVIEPFDENEVEYSYDIIEKCGHYPWREKYGKDEFLNIIVSQVKN